MDLPVGRNIPAGSNQDRGVIQFFSALLDQSGNEIGVFCMRQPAKGFRGSSRRDLLTEPFNLLAGRKEIACGT